MSSFFLHAQAAPNTGTTYDTTPLSAESDPFLSKAAREGLPTSPTESFYFGLGYGAGDYLDPDHYLQGPTLVLRYAPVKWDDLVWDYQIEFNTANILGLTVGRRWYFKIANPWTPYYRFSAGTFLDGFTELGGLVDLERWRVRGSAGIGQKYNFEAGIGYALAGLDYYAQFGYLLMF